MQYNIIVLLLTFITTLKGAMMEQPVKKRRGRPPKALIESKTKRGKVGRPAGDAAAIAEYKARLLASPKSRKVLDSILDAALNDEHKNQAAAWKLLMDRLLPVSYFDKDKDGGNKAAVNISISGIGGEEIHIGSKQPVKDDTIIESTDFEVVDKDG